jgi:23S rRNA (cytidine1920-2'-O)/16S rRNA (cytidine1409-2'-O)-methyltransferase
MEKERLDVLIAARGLAESRSLAQRLVMAGQVRVNGQVVLKPSTQIPTNGQIEIEHGPKFVSRGGEKLEAALLAFGLEELPGWVCVDVGSSTGGFTDCLLQHGAARVYAVDVGYGVLHWKLRSDPRVISQERTNARFVTGFPEVGPACDGGRFLYFAANPAASHPRLVWRESREGSCFDQAAV